MTRRTALALFGATLARAANRIPANKNLKWALGANLWNSFPPVPFTEILDVHWCEAHLPSREGADDATVATAINKIKSFSGARRRGLATRGPQGGLLAEIRQWYRAALEAVGLDPVRFPVHSSALRELDLRARDPGVRLLYGVDTEREIAVVVLGERLDRNFYGDSVRLAERLWKQFLQGNLRARERAPLR